MARQAKPYEEARKGAEAGAPLGVCTFCEVPVPKGAAGRKWNDDGPERVEITDYH